MVDREDAVATIKQSIQSNFVQRSIGRKNEVDILCAPGHVRVGKTTLGEETPSLIGDVAKTESSFKESTIREALYFKIDFSNGLWCSPFVDGQLSIRRALAVRLGCIAANAKFSELDRAGASEIPDVADVIDVILDVALDGATDEKTVVPIVVHFDEYGEYHTWMKENVETAPKAPFKEMVKELRAAVMTEPTKMPHTLRKKFEAGQYFVVPICTGTTFGDVSFKLTEGKLSPVTLPLLTIQQTQAVARSLLSLNAGTNQERADTIMKSNTFQIALGDCGGAPGFLSFLAKLDDTVITDEAYCQLMKTEALRITEKLGKKPDGWDDIVSLMMSNLPVEPKDVMIRDHSLADLADRGYFHMVEPSPATVNRQIRIVPALLCVRTWTRDACSVSGLLHDVSKNTPWTWQQYEIFNAHYTAAVLRALALWGPKLGRNVTIRDVLRGAVPSTAPELDVVLVIPPSFIGNSIVSEGMQCLPPKSTDSVQVNDYANVHLCGNGNRNVDAYVNVRDTGGISYTIFFQYKHTDSLNVANPTELNIAKVTEMFTNVQSRMKQARKESPEKWNGRHTLFCVVSNRALNGDTTDLACGDDIDHGTLIISKEQMQEYYHVFAGRGLAEVTEPADDT